MVRVFGRERAFAISLLILASLWAAIIVVPPVARATEIEAKGKALDVAFSQLHGNLEEIIERVRSSEKQLAAALERQDVLLGELDAATAEADALRNALSEARATHQTEARARAQLEASLADARRELTDAQERLTTTSAHFDKLNERFIETKRLLSAELGYEPERERGDQRDGGAAVADVDAQGGRPGQSEDRDTPGQSEEGAGKSAVHDGTSHGIADAGHGLEVLTAGLAPQQTLKTDRAKDAAARGRPGKGADPQALEAGAKQTQAEDVPSGDLAGNGAERSPEILAADDQGQFHAGVGDLEDMSTGALATGSRAVARETQAPPPEHGPSSAVSAGLSKPDGVEPMPVSAASLDVNSLVPAPLDRDLIERLAIEVGDEAIRFRLAGEGLFGFDSDAIAKRGAQDLDVVASLVRELDPERLVITGHTDSTGDPGYNLWLSRKRARAVGDALIARGVRSKLVIEGVGAGQPIADNRTFEGRRANRRVEFALPLTNKATPTAVR